MIKKGAYYIHMDNGSIINIKSELFNSELLIVQVVDGLEFYETVNIRFKNYANISKSDIDNNYEEIVFLCDYSVDEIIQEDPNQKFVPITYSIKQSEFLNSCIGVDTVNKHMILIHSQFKTKDLILKHQETLKEHLAGRCQNAYGEKYLLFNKKEHDCYYDALQLKYEENEEILKSFE